MTYSELCILIRMTRMTDPIDALQFCDDPTFPLTPADRADAIHIRSHFDYFSDSTVDDLIDWASRTAPITYRANRDANYTPMHSTLIDINSTAGTHTAIFDLALN